MQRFKNKVVVVTGAGSGIGRSTSIRLDNEGAKLIMVDVNKKALSETKSMIKNNESTAKVLDISLTEDVKKFFQVLMGHRMSLMIKLKIRSQARNEQPKLQLQKHPLHQKDRLPQQT